MKNVIGTQEFQELQEELLQVNNEQDLLEVLRKIDPEFNGDEEANKK